MLVTGLAWSQAPCGPGPDGQYPAGTITVNSDGSSTVINTCNYSSEFSVVDGVVPGNDYEVSITLDGADLYVTVENSADDSVIAHGASPFTFTAPAGVTGLHLNWSEDDQCTYVASGCRVTSIQDLTVAADACIAPSGFDSSPAAMSADLSWTSGGGTTVDFNVEVYLSGESAANGDSPVFANANVSGEMVTATGLSPVVDYDAYITANCSGATANSDLVGPESFTTLDVAPANDDFANAIAIACGDTVNGDTTNATIDEGDAPDEATVEEDTSADTDSPNIWYSFMGTGDIVTLSTCGTESFDTEIFVFTGTSGNLTLIDDGYDECGSGDGYAAETSFTSVNGTQYWVSIEGFNVGNVGTFGLVVTCEAAPTCTAPTIDSSTIVESCNPDGTGTFSVDIVVSDAGDAGTVFDDGTNTYPVVAGTVTAGPYNSGDSVTINIDATDDDCDSELGTFEFTCPQLGEGCANPLAATVEAECSTATPITIDFSTAPDIGPAGSCDTTTGNIGQWFEFTAPASGTVTISNSGANNEYVILDACDGTEVVCGSMPASETISGLTASAVYKLAIWKDSFNPLTTDDFCIEAVNCTAPNIDSATEVEDTCNPDGTGTFNVEIVVSDAGDAGSVFDDGTNTYPVVAGTVVAGPYNSGDSVTISIDAIDDVCDSELGTFEFTCPQPAPVNDLFADAISIGCGDAVMGTTIAATQDESDAPGVATVEDDTSADNDSPWVWYSFTGSGASEEVTLSTCGVANTDFDTELFVYTGSSGSLTLIDDGYDECGTGAENYAAETTFTSDGTTTYYIAVGGYDSDDIGNFQLTVSCLNLSLTDLDNPAAFTYFPNPVKNTLNLNAQNTIENVRMYNMLGQEVLRATPNNVDSELDLSNLQTGTYFVKVTIASVTKTIRVIKQ